MSALPQPDETAPTGKKRRWLRRLLLLVLLLPLLALVLGGIALRSFSARQAILGKVSRSFEESSGIRAQAADFTLYVARSALELDGVVLSTGDAAAFLTAESVRVEFRWKDLFGEPTVLETVTLERPVVDLRQPLPPPSDEPPPRIDVHDLRLIDGRLVGTPSEDDEPWLKEWSAEGVEIAGSYVDGQVDLRLQPARVNLARTVDAPIDVEVASRITGPLDGPYVVDELKVTGDGLSLDADGQVGAKDDQPFLVRLDFDVDPARLVAGIEPGGFLRVTGAIDLRTYRGNVHIVAQDFPSEALEPWIGEAARPDSEPSFIDLDARFQGDPDARRQVTGEAELAWRQGEKLLAEATVTLADGRLDGDGVVLESLVGDVRATARDLPAELLRPWLGAGHAERFAIRGTRLDLEADFRVDAARPSEPEGHLDLVWRRGDEHLLVASARTLAPDAEPRLRIEYEATLLPSQGGRRHLQGRLAAASWTEVASGELSETRLALELPDVAAAAADARRRWPRLFEDAGFRPDAFPKSFQGHVDLVADVAGKLDAPHVELDGVWRPSATSRVAVAASGEPLRRSGDARLTLERFDLALLPQAMTGALDGTVTASGSPQDWTGTLDLDGSGLRYGSEMPAFEELHLEATTDGTSVQVTALSGRTGEARFTGDGRIELDRPLADAAPRIQAGRLHLAAEAPFSGVDRVDFDAELRDGVVHVTRLDLEAPTGPGDLVAEIPLGALRALELDVDAWPVEVADGRVEVDLAFPSLDLGNLVLDVGQDPPWTTHEASLTGRLWIDPTNLMAAEGELLVEHWLLEVGRHRVEVADDPILLALADGKLEAIPVTLQADGHPVDLAGSLALSPDWQLGDDVSRLVSFVTARADGILDSGLLTPYLAGGVAEGPVAVDFELAGGMEDLTAHGVVDGPQAMVVYASPYMTQIREPHLELEMAGGEITVTGVTAQLNGGPLYADVRRSPEGDWTATARFESARFAFDYGLTAIVHGDLWLELPAEGTGSLTGSLDVERAVQRRDLDLNREILNALFGPSDISGAGSGAVLDLELDLEVTTARGVRIKNNLVDLYGGWGTLTVQGTVADPAIEGRIDVDPGGYFYAYGQTARIEQGALIWTGEPGLPPEIEFQPTWDSQDPTVAAAGDPVQELRMDWGPTVKSDDDDDKATGIDDQLLGGLTGWVGGRVVGRLAGANVRIQPVLVFGETDPSAKLVISRDLSPWIAFAVAVDLRDSQRQTYVLDLHRLRHLPPIAFQLFTEDGENEGVTVQQTVSFGRGGKTAAADADAQRLRRVHFETVLEGISLKALRKAVGYDKGDPLPDGADFEVEVNLAEHLRALGYPGARVDVVTEPAGRKAADLAIAVAPGPHVVFEFVGTEPPRALRRTITEPYRVDFYERTSLDEVRQQAVRALRSRGHLDPQVEVDVAVDGAARGTRTVTVRAEGGEKIRLDRLVFHGVDAATSSLLESRFVTRVARIELAAAVPQADDWLIRNLRAFGYPEATITSRRLTADGHELEVAIAAGPRQELTGVRIEGLAAAQAATYLDRLPLGPGDVPRSDRVAAGNLLIRNDLKRRGFSEVRVRTRLFPVTQGGSRMRLLYEVEPGPRYRVESIRFAGLDATRPKWAKKVAELEESQVLDPEALGTARRLLVGTRLFQSVRSVSDRAPDGQAHVTFEVEEAPRYQLAYGIRWESNVRTLTGTDLSLVLDVLDRNFLGRGVTVGLRGLYGNRDEAARLYARRAGIFGRRLGIEVYLEQRHEETRPTQDFVDDTLLIDSTEGSLQVSFPLGTLHSQVYGRFKRTKIREKIPFDPFFPFEEEIRFPFVGWQLFYDRRDDKISPSRGFFASTDLSATGDYLDSDFDFVRLFSQLQWMRPAFRLGDRQVTWAQSYRVGFFTSQDDFPLSDELFRAGGERSVRGYPFESLDASGRGGEALLVINQELRMPVWRLLSGVVFFDLGNVWDDKGDFGSDLFTSVGLGVRADTPIGLLRLDFGFPLDRMDGDPSVKTYFGFGHAF